MNPNHLNLSSWTRIINTTSLNISYLASPQRKNAFTYCRTIFARLSYPWATLASIPNAIKLVLQTQRPSPNTPNLGKRLQEPSEDSEGGKIHRVAFGGGGLNAFAYLSPAIGRIVNAFAATKSTTRELENKTRRRFSDAEKSSSSVFDSIANFSTISKIECEKYLPMRCSGLRLNPFAVFKKI